MASLTIDDARARAGLLEVQRYEIALDLSGGGDTFGCLSAIDFRCREPGASTFVDVRPRTLVSATLNGERLDVTELRDGRLPLRGLAPDNHLVIEAEMAYSRDGEGLHRSVDHADGNVYLYAMTFLDAAPRVFACFDQPDLKARYAISVEAPPEWSVIGNSPATQVSPGQWQLRETLPLSTYLITLVAGPYHSVRRRHDGIELGLHSRQSLAPHLDKDAHELFTVTAQAFDAYHRLFGIRYPFGDYHQVFVPEFNAGAMENPGCVTFRDGLLFRSVVTDGERSERARIVVHEMAHQWFGDLVTMQWWDDLWLNESFADYVAYRVTHEATAFADSWVSTAFRRKYWGLAADQRPSTHPVASNGAADAASALTDFDGISYAKGSATLKQLNAHIGDDVFFDGVRAHLRDHSYANASLADLMRAWRDAGATDVDDWAAGWLRTAGVDCLQADTTEDGYVVRRIPPERFPARRVHRVVVQQFGEGKAGTPVPVAITDDTTTLPIKRERELPFVHIDSRDDTWAKLRFDVESTESLSRVLPTIPDPVARASIWTGLRDAVDDAHFDPRELLTLMELALPAETEDIALTSLLGSARSTLGRLIPEAGTLERIAALAYRCVRVAPVASSRQVAAARAWLANEPDGDRLRALLAGDAVPDGLSMDTEMRWTAVQRLCVLGQGGDELIAAELKRDDTSEGEVHAAECRAALPDAPTKERVWTAIVSDAELSNYELYALCDGFWQPEQVELCAGYVDRYFTELPPTSAFRSGWVVQESATAAFPRYAVDRRTLDLAGELLKRPGVPTLVVRAVLDESDGLRRALASRDRYRVAV